MAIGIRYIKLVLKIVDPALFLAGCTNPVGIKVIKDAFTKALNAHMHLRMQSSKGREMRRLRHSTVEPVLGTLVNFTTMKEVTTKGISLANKCMIRAAVAYNLKKLINGIPIRVRNRTHKSLKNVSYTCDKTCLNMICILTEYVNRCYKANG